MKLPRVTQHLPSGKNSALAVFSAVLLILAFPDFEFWFLAWFGLVPLLWAIEGEKESAARSFVLGWIWGFVFFSGTCWWLTFAPITYAGFPWPVAYFLLFCVTGIVGVFPGAFALILSILLRRFGNFALLAAPFIWVSTEFLRYWLTGNNWNAIGYSQAFRPVPFLGLAGYGGVLLVGFFVAQASALLALGIHTVKPRFLLAAALLLFLSLIAVWRFPDPDQDWVEKRPAAQIVAVQPNVPMSGLTYEKWKLLRAKHVELAESALNFAGRNPQSAIRNPQSTTTVIFPESPMNFAY
jgi:apolipoprotein N-acyltransferase